MEYANICDYERYKFHSKLLHKTGIYIDTLYTSCGCDSVFTLNLHVQPTLRDTTEATICLGDYYVFGGNMLYTDGIYSDTIYHPETNECEIDMLKLYIVGIAIENKSSLANQRLAFVRQNLLFCQINHPFCSKRIKSSTKARNSSSRSSLLMMVRAFLKLVIYVGSSEMI